MHAIRLAVRADLFYMTKKGASADPKKLGYVGSQPGSRDSNSWFTPATYIEAARKALGGKITLDPFSSDKANQVVKAKRFFTESDNAFEQNWKKALKTSAGQGTLFMNPPYSGALCSQAVNRVLDEWEAGTFSAGVFLVNNSTETKWFQRALRQANGICLTDHRISFWNADGKTMSGNTRGQAFFYFGTDFKKFKEAFSGLGTVIQLGK